MEKLIDKIKNSFINSPFTFFTKNDFRNLESDSKKIQNILYKLKHENFIWQIGKYYVKEKNTDFNYESKWIWFLLKKISEEHNKIFIIPHHKYFMNNVLLKEKVYDKNILFFKWAGPNKTIYFQNKKIILKKTVSKFFNFKSKNTILIIDTLKNIWVSEKWKIKIVDFCLNVNEDLEENFSALSWTLINHLKWIRKKIKSKKNTKFTLDQSQFVNIENINLNLDLNEKKWKKRSWIEKKGKTK